MRAFVYLRQSLDRNGSRAAVDRQREDCKKLCAERDWTIVHEYVDNDVSASSKKPRAAYRRMFAAVERGEAEVIVAWHVDRLTRKLTELEELIELSSRTGVRIATATGDVDLTTDAGRLIGRILASVARAEVERKGARQKRARQQAAQAGKPGGGRRAFGYTADGLSVNESEAERLRVAYSVVLQGGTLRGIATSWNAEGITTTAGGEWNHSTVRRTLQNARNAGLSTYHGEIVGPGTWPAIVDRETYDAVRALLALPERRTTFEHTTRLYLLPGLARCYCGAIAKTGRTQHGKRTYRCGLTRGHMSRAAEPIDNYVTALVIERLSRPDALELLSNRETVDLAVYRRKADAIRERIDDLATGLAEGLLTLKSVRTASDRLQAELATVEAEMTAGIQTDALGPLLTADDLGEAWERLDLDRKRAVIDTLMTITLQHPKRGRQPFDPDSVTIGWRA
jgi:site-specific DNA recombinase